MSPRAWAARTWLAVSALPVGALAGCTTLVLATSADRPALGLLGLGAAVVPLSVASWRARSVDVDPTHGRRALGRPLTALDAEQRRWEWQVHALNRRVRLEHGIDPAGTGTTAWVRIHLPAALVALYAPLAHRALQNLVTAVG